MSCFTERPTNIITGSNDIGEYLGTPKDKNLYIGYNKGLAIDVYPINVHKHESQYATFAILAAKGNGRDPLCIVDFGLGLPNVSRTRNHGFHKRFIVTSTSMQVLAFWRSCIRKSLSEC